MNSSSFALSNAGVSLGGGLSALLSDRVSLGVIGGLVIGKQVGVSLAAWLAELPEAVNWWMIYATGWLAGIGFTMSLFISGLAFGDAPQAETAKLGILAASLIAGLVGYWLLRRISAKPIPSRSPLDV